MKPYFVWHELNYTIIVTKKTKQLMGWPYGQCRHYRTNEHQLGATSQTQCYRYCLKQLYIDRFKCVPLFIDKLLHESDLNYMITTGIELCEPSEQMLKILRNIDRNVCRNKCPEDCHKISYTTSKIKSIEHFGSQNWFDLKW